MTEHWKKELVYSINEALVCLGRINYMPIHDVCSELQGLKSLLENVKLLAEELPEEDNGEQSDDEQVEFVGAHRVQGDLGERERHSEYREEEFWDGEF